MSTSTAKLGLVKAATTDTVDVVAHLGAAYDKIDLALPTQVCTSGSRPGTPFAGQMIWETDTLNAMVYTGTRWWPLNASYDSAAARNSALASPQEGMLVWLEDTNIYEYYNGSAWAELHVAAGADTGWVTSTTGWTIATNFAIGGSGVRYRIKNGLVSIYFDVDRNTSVIGNNTDGNIANTNVFTAIPTVARPLTTAYCGTAGVGRGCTFTVASSGIITINTATGTSDIGIGEQLSGYGTYFKD